MVNNNESPDFFEKPGTIKLLWVLLYAVCIFTLVPEFFIHRHPHFAYDGYFGFFALLGFVACALLIIIAKGIGLFLKKNVNYYDN
jgi:membrane protease YdiL (CAAX protease family)